MFDLGAWGEFFIIVVAALVLIGPKELPSVLRTLGRLIQKGRAMTAGVRREIDRYVQEGEVEEYINQVNVLGDLEPRQKASRKAPRAAPSKKKKDVSKP